MTITRNEKSRQVAVGKMSTVNIDTYYREHSQNKTRHCHQPTMQGTSNWPLSEFINANNFMGA
jgi:hypothetical protein